MAETTVTPTQLSFNTGVEISQGAGEAINTANTMHFAYPNAGKLLIVIDSDHADTAAVVGAGDFVAAGKGTTTIAVGNGKSYLFIPESDRHVDEDGNVVLSWAENSAGFVRAFYLL